MDCIVYGVTKSQTRLSDFHFHHFIRRVGEPYKDVLNRESENGKKIQDEWNVPQPDGKGKRGVVEWSTETPKGKIKGKERLEPSRLGSLC